MAGNNIDLEVFLHIKRIRQDELATVLLVLKNLRLAAYPQRRGRYVVKTQEIVAKVKSVT